MKDTFGDPIEVYVNTFGAIYLTVHDGQKKAQADASLTPKKARRLARALKDAAKEAAK